MTTVKTLATHQVVQRAHPREVTERDELGMASGKAIDSALSRLSHAASRGESVPAAAILAFATSILDEELDDADLTISPEIRQEVIAQVGRVIRVFRQSVIYGLPRPKSRMVLIDEQVGVYAQPDYWDGAHRFYEMKSYRAFPMSPEVELQLQLFQLAFPNLRAHLIWFDRHANPVVSEDVPLPALEELAKDQILRLAFATGREHGVDKVLEYIDAPVVRYRLPR